MQHLDEGTIHSWLDGALSADEAARVEAHVAECPQCAAAVAEARGFIAASSRILTALDHVPRGVVPVVPAVKWYNRAAWRAAAAVVVVAVGSLMVVRNSDRTATVATPAFDTAGATKAAVTQPQIMTPSAATTVQPKIQSGTQIRPSIRGATSSGVTLSGKPTTEVDFSGKSTHAAAQPNVVAREGARNEGVDATVGQNAGAPSMVAGALAAAPQAAAPSHAEGVAALDVAKAQPLKVVGRPRMLGAKVTLYEVAPGDTVTLTELTSPQLEGIVVTGSSSAQPLMGRAAGKSAAAPAQRANAAVVSAPDSQSRAAAVEAPVISQAASPMQVGVASGVTTITWPDPATHNTLRLSGRMPVERLKEIKLRIERERAAAAAKKSP
jgi:hypothetical protein